MKVKINILLSLVAAILLGGCHTLDDDRIPPSAVTVVFQTIGDWESYGVGGALQYRRFIKKESIPSGYPYKAIEYTGFGGVLLVCDYYGNPCAYDLACPVECKSNIRVQVDNDLHIAVCPQCGSSYYIFENYGHPYGGEAAERGYGLRRYSVVKGGTGTEYMLITN
jgi:hypothetical protein